MKHALILGATSGLARAIAARLARDGWGLTLAGRDPDALSREAADLSCRSGADVRTAGFDALAFDTHEAFAASLPVRPDAVYCVFGYLGDPARAQSDAAERRRILDTNFTGAVSLLEPIAADMASRGTGLLVGISSVAGERGRGSHPYYCAAKAGFSAYLDGLRGRLRPSGVRVLTVKPGYLRTRMTDGMRLPPLLTASPERAAAAIVRAAARGRDRVFVPGIWRPVMALLRLVPERIFKRLPL